MTLKKHYGDEDGIRALSYNGIITSIISNRNYGKTWTFKKRAFRRAIKKGKKTIWLRTFQKEKKEAVATFFNSSDLQKYCGISFYDKEGNPNGNLKQEGNTFYYRVGKMKKWNWFIKVFALTDKEALRSADDVEVDTIVFDEYTKTIDRYNRFRGNMVEAFIDILFSAKREHEVRCILLGNKESVNNPFFSYFGIKPLPSTYEGIKVYRNGAFVVQQINNVSEDKNEYDRKVRSLLEGTGYGGYIYSSQFKGMNNIKTRKTPAGAPVYCQVYVNGVPLKISSYGGAYYVNSRIENSKTIYCDVMPNRWAREMQLVKRNRREFLAFINAIADNLVYYDSEMTKEAMQPFMQWLGI